MYTYIYICMYNISLSICIYIYIYTCMLYIYIYIYLSLYIYIYIYMKPDRGRRGQEGAPPGPVVGGLRRGWQGPRVKQLSGGEVSDGELQEKV